MTYRKTQTQPMDLYDWLTDPSPAINAQKTWQDGTYDQSALYQLNYTSPGPFAIACGAELLADLVRQFKFTPELIQRLGQIREDRYNIFSESFLNHLQRMRLSLSVWAPPEGMLLLPGAPLLILRGPTDQIMLMESAFQELVLHSTHHATQAALARWERRDWPEEDTPDIPQVSVDRSGRAVRATYIGGGDQPGAPAALHAQDGLKEVWRDVAGYINGDPAVTQIRRAYRGQEAVGDIWLTSEQSRKVSISRTSARLRDAASGEVSTLRFTRFQNIYQPVLTLGKPVLAKNRINYLRQRTLKQLAAFYEAGLSNYPHGWFLDNE
jgi:hypothetical protein